MKKFFSFLVGLLIFSLLPVLGWGAGDVNGFLQNPYRLAFIVMMAILSIIVVIFVPNEGRGFGEGKKLIRRQRYTILFLQVLPLLINILSPAFDRYDFGTFHESSGLRIIGLVLTFFGFSLMNWSVIILGKQFSVDVTIQENHRLITSGPYKYIRHPRYLGILIFLVGVPVVFLSWIPLLLDILLAGVLLWRISDEEKLMQQEFKNDWEEYRKNTFSLIPFLY